MAKLRRLTMNPPLSEAELAGFRAANPGLKIDREPSGVIILRRKRRRSDEPVDCVMSGIDLRDEKRPIVGAEVSHVAEDTETLQALEALEGRLLRERETFEGAHASALNIAIRAVISARNVLESLMAYEQRMPQELTSKDLGTYDERRAHLNREYRSAGKTLDQLDDKPSPEQCIALRWGLDEKD